MHSCNKHNEIELIKQAIEVMQADVKLLVQFQTQVEVKDQQKELYDRKLDEIRKVRESDKKWRIGLTISTIMGLLGIVVSMLVLLVSDPNNKDDGVTAEEFQALWEEYKEKHNLRGIYFEPDTI